MHLLATPLAEFSHRQPEVLMNIVLDSRLEDIIEQGYDLVLRSAVLADSNLIAQKLTTFENILCVSPAYLNEHGSIDNLAQLSEQRFAVYGRVNSEHQLTFSYQQRQYSLTIKPYLHSNSLDFIKQMTLAGSCIAILPDFMVKVELHTQHLQRCLPAYSSPASPLYALYPDKSFMPLRVSAFLDVLKNYFAKI